MTGEPLHIEQFSKDLNAWYEVYVYCPEPGKAALIYTNVTERKQAEEAIRQSREAFRALADNSPDNVDRLDRESRHLFVNAAAVRLFGVPPEEVVGKTNRQLGTPDPWAGIWEERIREVFETGQPLDVEDAFPGKEGLRFWQIRCVPGRASDGTVASVLAVARDITERMCGRRSGGRRSQAGPEHHQQHNGYCLCLRSGRAISDGEYRHRSVAQLDAGADDREETA